MCDWLDPKDFYILSHSGRKHVQFLFNTLTEWMNEHIWILQTGSHKDVFSFFYDDCKSEYDIAPFYDTLSSEKPWRQSIIIILNVVKKRSVKACEKIYTIGAITWAKYMLYHVFSVCAKQRIIHQCEQTMAASSGFNNLKGVENSRKTCAQRHTSVSMIMMEETNRK